MSLEIIQAASARTSKVVIVRRRSIPYTVSVQLSEENGKRTKQK